MIQFEFIEGKSTVNENVLPKYKQKSLNKENKVSE